MEIKQISLNDALYQQERALRNEVLLRPIGLADFAWEHKDGNAFHIAAVENNKLLGCVLLYPLPDQSHSAQLMQMAVSSARQNKGIGSELIRQLLDVAKENDIHHIFCHARHDAINFYLKHQFNTSGEPFEEVGIMHTHMQRSL